MRKKTKLTDVDKKYITLTLQTTNNINYELLFERLGIELNVPTDVVRDYANKVPEYAVVPEEPKPEPPKLTEKQKTIRQVMNPTSANGRQNVTVMSDGAAGIIDDDVKNQPIKGSARFNRNVFRGNK